MENTNYIYFFYTFLFSISEARLANFYQKGQSASITYSLETKNLTISFEHRDSEE